jgi:hypothetical protein
VGRNLTFPDEWHFVGGARPTSIAAKKIGWLGIWCLGGNDTDRLAGYSVEA